MVELNSTNLAVGASAVVDMSNRLGEAGVPVNLVVSLDPVSQAVATGRVTRLINLYLPGGSGVAVVRGRGFRGSLQNINVAKQDAVVDIPILGDVKKADRQGLVADLDHALLPNMTNLYSEAMNLEYDPGNKVSVPYAWGTTGLCYRSDLVGETPDSWMDLLQPAAALKGKVTMLSTDRWLMGATELPAPLP